jgi:hypothetical protein
MHVALSAINVLIGLGIVFGANLTAKRLRGSTMFWVAAVFLFTGLTVVAHGLAEILNLGAGTSAVSSYVATILLFFAVVIVDLSTKVLGVK